MAHDRNDEQRNCRVTFDPTIYDPASVCAFLERYRRLLKDVSRYPNKAISNLLVMSGLGCNRDSTDIMVHR